jgi:hypothetical protein
MKTEQDELYLRKLALRGTTSSAPYADEVQAIKSRWKGLKQKDELEELFS